MLFEITFETSVWHLHTGKNYEKHCINLKATFGITLFLIKEIFEQMAASKYYKYGPYVSSSTDETFKKIYVMVTHFFKFSCFIF